MDSELDLQLFGNIRILDQEGRPISLSSSRDAALLFYLAVKRDTPHRREHLYTILWPDMPETSARHNLRQALYQLRLNLQNSRETKDSPALLIANRSKVQLNPDFSIRVDVHDFLAALDVVRTHLHSNLSECLECRASLKWAVERYRGEFLEGFYLDDSAEYESWAQARRTAYREQMLAALDNLSEIHLAAQDYKAVQHYAEWQLNLDPLRESAYYQLMRAQALEGDRIGAMRTYQHYDRLLQEELGIAPSLLTQEFYQTLRETDAPGTVTGLKEMFIRGYQIVEQIGPGVSGTVYRAAQAQVGREVAIKVFPPEIANQPDFIRRFESEAQSLANLEHPYIVPLYDYWREPDGAYMVMRFFQGNLSRKLTESPLELAEVGRFVDQVAAALSAAHRKGIIHGNLKPTNILMDKDGNFYLSDFGLAQATQPDILSPRKGGHTRSHYLAPEQIKGEPITPQTDLFSLAILLFELLAGQHPFPNAAKGSLKIKLVADPLPLVSTHRPGLPEELDTVIQQATRKNLTERFADLNEFAFAFRQVVEPSKTAQASSMQETEVLPNPYKGLRAFQETDATDFFGREALTRQLLTRLQESAETHHFLAVVGPSGSGKSSVVRAGLVSGLRRGTLDGSQDWFIVEMTPGTHPLEELELVLTRIAPNPSLNLLELFRRDTRGLLQATRMILPADESRLLLVIDQFEEVFTLVEDPAETEFFLSSLYVAVTDARSPIHTVITLRADFYDRPLNHDKLGSLMEQCTQVVLPMTNDEIGLAIRKPAERVGVDFEEGLVTTLISDIIQQPGALPLLQYALFELFEHRQGHLLTTQSYREIGGLSGALGRRAEEVYASLRNREQQTARQMFLRLVTLGDGVEDTRRRVRQSELEAMQQIESRVENVLEKFGQARLLTFDHDPITRGPTVEVAHEALLSKWPRLSAWLEQSRADILQQRQLARLAQEWENADGDLSFLLRGARLETFRAWEEKTNLGMTTLENTFLEASVTGWEREQEAKKQQLAREQALEARSRTILRVLVAVFAIATVLSLFLSNFAFQQQRIAQSNASTAVIEANARGTAQAEIESQARLTQSLYLASQSLLALQRANRDLALSLALAAVDTKDIPSIAESALSEAAYAPGLAFSFELPGAYSVINTTPDGEFTLSKWLSQVRVWDLHTETPKVYWDLDHGIYSLLTAAAISPDANQLIIGMRSDGLVLLDVKTGEILQQLPGTLTGEVLAVAFSSDGQYAIFSSGIRNQDPEFTVPQSGINVWLWDLISGDLALRLEGHQNAVNSVAIDATGKTALTGSVDGSLIWWDLESGKLLQTITIRDHATTNSVAVSVAFGPDSKTALASWGFDVSLWNLETGQQIRFLGSHSAQVRHLAISPNAKWATSGDDDGEIRVWELETGGQFLRFTMTGSVEDLQFSTDSQKLIFSDERNVNIWSLNYGAEIHRIERENNVAKVSFSPDGSLAAYLENTVLHIWDPVTWEESADINLPANGLNFAFTPDGQQVLVSLSNGDIMQFRSDSESEGQRLGGENNLTGHTKGVDVNAIAISSDGSKAISGSWEDKNYQVILWNLKRGKPIKIIVSPNILSVAISPDGKTALTSNLQGQANQRTPQVILWDLSTGLAMKWLDGHSGSVLDVAYSPDSKSALTASSDSTLILWTLADGSILHRLLGHEDGVTSVAFHPDGHTAISGSRDGTLILWNLATGEAIRRYRGHSGSVTSVAFNPDGSAVLSADTEGAIILWRIDNTLQELIDWANANRIIEELSCLEREQFNIEPLCK